MTEGRGRTVLRRRPDGRGRTVLRCRTAAVAALMVLVWPGSAGCARAQEGAGGERQDVGPEGDFAAERRALVESLADPGARLPPVRDSLVLEAVGRVPRHRFVPERLRGLAYTDRPLPIGQDQTISQPYIVARMTELLELSPGEKVLEVGTGSGYQAAVLAEITDSVYSVEIIPELARGARGRLRALGYDRVRVRIGNGWHGWEAHAPFDAVVVTAAPEEVPRPLVEQLAPGGRMVIPVGPRGGVQRLLLLRKGADGSVSRQALDPVRFVPLIREGGSARDTAIGVRSSTGAEGAEGGDRSAVGAVADGSATVPAGALLAPHRVIS